MTDSFPSKPEVCPHEPGWKPDRCPWCEIERALQERDQLRAGLELIGGRDTPEGLIARETLAGRGPRPAHETAGEPAAWMTDDGRVVNAESKRTCRNSSLNSYMIPLYRRTKETSDG